jgi:signal transduction histidine kinase
MGVLSVPSIRAPETAGLHSVRATDGKADAVPAAILLAGRLLAGPVGVSGTADIERNIAQCRVILSIAAFVTVFIDPTRPTLTRLIPLTGGPFTLDPYAVAVLVAYVVYAFATFLVVDRRLLDVGRVATASTWADVLFAAAIALVTEGANSPSYVFFAFAVLAAGFRSGLRPALAVTAASVGLYLSLIVVSRPDGVGFYVMRPAYLAITGYLVGYLGERRLEVEARVRELEAARQRERIARSLHDEYVQALSAVNVRLETCRELLRHDRGEQALIELTELQAGVNREHDDLRTYIRSLIDREATPSSGPGDDRTHFSVRAEFEGSLVLVEHALQIMLEGARNVGRHARAQRATITVERRGETVAIAIQDDGVGFSPGAVPPWSIASRAAELGGAVRVANGDHRGAHVRIDLPET